MRFDFLLTIQRGDSNMRKRFEQQLSIGTIPIGEVVIKLKGRDRIKSMLAALQEIFINPEYNEKIFSILEDRIVKGKKKTGRPGMDLWQIFVLAQFRLCLNISYDRLEYMADNDSLLRRIMGIEKGFGYEPIEVEYQSIIDNVTLLDDVTIRELNEVIVKLGHDIFKKKEGVALRLKTDSFVVESNVHFPTDYNLLWDCARKCLDAVSAFLVKYPDLPEWRKIRNWKNELKGLMRSLGQANASGGKNKERRVLESTRKYLNKAIALSEKIATSKKSLPIFDEADMAKFISLEHFETLLIKHMDLVERRLIKGETIPHEEKMFSIFEEYTEWITKGKLHPNVELGKKTAITTDQYGLIVDYRVMENEADSEIVLPLASKLLKDYIIESWSFDKGFFHKENKLQLKKQVAKLIMPKKGKRNQEEEVEENERGFIRLRHGHSAIESNINELEHRGLDRCPDRGYGHFKRYIGLAVGAYNLTRIGKKLFEEKREVQKRAA